jgi:hypothetical protein
MSGCYGDGYPIPAALCGEGTVNVRLDASGRAYAHTFALAYTNVNARSHANTHACTSR